MQAPAQLFEKDTLERLERLAIRWQRSFSGLLGGNNVSRYPGIGHEFLDHRHFHQGDDLRSVNWRAYLRLGRLFLKMFRTEPRTPVRILLDTSESMACGASADGPGEPKFAYACRLTAALCFIGLVRLETVVVQPFSDRLAESYRAQGGRHRFAPAAQFIGELSTSGRSDFANVARQFLAQGPSAGLAIILSDFVDEFDGINALQYLADYGQELLLIQVAGVDDQEPSWQGELELVDAESGEVLRQNVDRRTLDEYRNAYDQHCRSVEYMALRNGGRYLHLGTDMPLNDVLYGALISAGSVSLQ